jgi:hypothetical protein
MWSFNFIQNFKAQKVRVLSMEFFQKWHAGWTPVAHTCNPSYSGGRDQEDHGSKPAQAKSS